MNSERHFGKKTALSAIALVLAVSASAFGASPLSVNRGVPAARVHAAGTRAVTVLHNFAASDGSAPEGNLDLAIGVNNNTLTRTLYGVTEGGGTFLSGTIYSFTLGSNAFSSLYQFSGGNDGSIPVEGLANNETNYFAAGQTQLGVTIAGGANGQGTVYAAAANGQTTVVHAFTGGADGGSPAGRLTLFTDGNYYGTTSSGGAAGFGTVYRITSSGAFTTIYSFTGGSDGGSPQAGLALNVNLFGQAKIVRGGPLNAAIERMAVKSKQFVSPYLYGTTSTAGANGGGTIFRITPAGNLQTIYGFTGGADGGSPAAKLTTDLFGDLYGTTTSGGSGGNGVVFVLANNATKPQVIHDFGDGSMGSAPSAQLTLGFNGNLYGTTTQGGASGQYGNVFEISSGGAFSDIHDFQGTDGANPQGGLVDGGDGNLYGTTLNGGSNSDGVLFSIQE